MWHINEKNNKSIIQEMFRAHENTNTIITIFTDNDSFDVFLQEDKVIIAEGFIYIESLESVKIININKIESIYIRRPKNDIDTE